MSTPSSSAKGSPRVLVVGAGIAGPTLAYWLARYGMRPTLLERAPALRTGGYIVDFWGAGYDITERMGLLPELHRRGYHIEELRLVGDRGQRVGGFGVGVFGRLMNGRYVSLPRSELSAALYGQLDDRTERVFGDELLALEERAGGVEVTLRHGGRRTFDLVVGADGLHSQVRALTFGEEAQLETHLGLEVAAFEAVGYRPREEDVYVLHTEPGRQVGRFAMRGDRTMFLFVYESRTASPIPHDLSAQKARVREHFSSCGWEVDRILEALDRSDELYLDRVSQIRMEGWTMGRVALVGDAAYCVSLIAGQGSALAIIGATILAGELYVARGDHEQAFERYEARLRPLIEKKQAAAERFARMFVPRSSFSLAVRNAITRVMSLPFVAEWAFGRDLRDPIEIPEYEAAGHEARSGAEAAERG